MPKKTTVEGSLQNVSVNGGVVGFKFGVRLPRYRGNMLSLINGYYVKVDGEEFPQAAIKLEINGKAPRSFGEIKTAVWEHWDYQDTAYLYIDKPGGLAPGMHEVLAVVSNFEQYGYFPKTDQQRVDEEILPTDGSTGYAGPSKPIMLELKS